MPYPSQNGGHPGKSGNGCVSRIAAAGIRYRFHHHPQGLLLQPIHSLHLVRPGIPVELRAVQRELLQGRRAAQLIPGGHDRIHQPSRERAYAQCRQRSRFAACEELHKRP